MNPLTASRFPRVSLLLIGLALTSCAGQADFGANSAAATTTTTTNISVVIESSENAAAVGQEIERASSTPPSSSTPPELSPLAAQAVRLPSALPERALAGLGDPIGVQPKALSLPGLGVERATIVPVGLESNGELEVPGASEVGWYEFGVGVDGGRGSTVLAAHIAYNGRDGVFRHLADSEVGEIVTVVSEGGPVDYRVESIEQFNKFELPIDDLFAEDGAERLVLITCGGSFNTNLRSYEDNTVVIAVPSNP